MARGDLIGFGETYGVPRGDKEPACAGRHSVVAAPERSIKMSQILAIFVTVFLAELGDKTQLATVLFAAGKETPPLTVFLAAAAALVLSTALAVALGVAAERHLTMIPLKLVAGIGFVVLGLWTVWDHVQTAPSI